jgi:RNase P protein component
LKEVYRLNEKTIVAGYDIVIVARTKSRYIRFSDLEASVISLFRNLKLLRNPDTNANVSAGGNSK